MADPDPPPAQPDKLPFREADGFEPDELALECPRCGRISVRRRDTVALRLHMLWCDHCFYTTNLVETLE